MHIVKQKEIDKKKSHNLKVLLAGESWVTHSIHIKGFDAFTTSEYSEGGTYLIGGLEKNGICVNFLPNHLAPTKFPSSLDELNNYDVIILSDIGSNTLYLHPETFSTSKTKPNRLELLVQYVKSGKGLAMIGGYLSFSGIDGKARYQRTPLIEVLPVSLVEGDDRVEVPQGAEIEITNANHPILDGIPILWPKFLGYNKLKARSGTNILARREKDVFLAVGEYGKGRTLAFASDCGPHWGPMEFVEWKYYEKFWCNCVKWLAKCC